MNLSEANERPIYAVLELSAPPADNDVDAAMSEKEDEKEDEEPAPQAPVEKLPVKKASTKKKENAASGSSQPSNPHKKVKTSKAAPVV